MAPARPQVRRRTAHQMAPARPGGTTDGTSDGSMTSGGTTDGTSDGSGTTSGGTGNTLPTGLSLDNSSVVENSAGAVIGSFGYRC